MVWGNPENGLEELLAQALSPASFCYGTAAYLRLAAYGKGIFKQRRLPVEVVSVGNLTCGGTGKTPVTIDLARRLVACARKVAILSRGYRRRSRVEQLVVSDGERMLCGPSEAGDEPYMIARTLPQAVVIVGADRFRSGMLAVESYGCDTVVLDDGFQHVRLARNQDVVCLDYADDLDHDRLLPAGRLREPAAALSRAHWVVVTRLPGTPDQERLDRIRRQVARHAPEARLSACRFLAAGIRFLHQDRTVLPPESIKGDRVITLAGLARAGRFAAGLQELGASVVRSRNYPDHFWYTQEHLERLREDIRETGADYILTTAKDAARLSVLGGNDLPMRILELKIEWCGPVPLFGNQCTSSDGGTTGGAKEEGKATLAEQSK